MEMLLWNSVSRLKNLVNKNPEAADINNSLKAYQRLLSREYSSLIIERNSLVISEMEEKANNLREPLLAMQMLPVK